MTRSQLDQMMTHGSSQQEAFDLFDRLEAVQPDEMWGLWQGRELMTGHRLEGLLAASGWYGKEFLDAEHVHPLIFQKRGGRLYKVNPIWAPLQLPLHWIPKTLLRPAMTILRPLIGTRRSAARLRQIQYRDQLSAAMVYDNKAIIDVFRKVDDDTLLGLMDIKSPNLDPDQTYFFVLYRAASNG
ncbi:hypothetical protein B9G55_05630 [Saccharibacillus sp. O16]|nr:hypothetical protein B9G55_05630 [Saccharibacillus sp. O16]